MRNEIPDWVKVVVAIASITGATNGAQYLGWTKPANVMQQEIELTQATVHQQLRECYHDLQDCYKECGASR